MRQWSVIFVAIMLISCQSGTGSKEGYGFIYQEGKATSLQIDADKLPAVDLDSLAVNLSVRVPGANPSDKMLGDLSAEGDLMVFTPVVPFSLSMYEIWYKDERLFNAVCIPVAPEPAPSVVAVYPSCDTIPSNLLKIYLQFSTPMMEERSSRFVQLMDSGSGDTVAGAFLDLKPELWDESQTILTLWLDPGRIKNDLIPNKEKGVVLQDNHQYRLIISGEWRGKNGVRIGDDYTRMFVTRGRDNTSPDVDAWKIHVQTRNAGDVSPAGLRVTTNDDIDWALSQAAISITMGEDIIPCQVQIGNCERALYITKSKSWERGDYVMHIESRLEDLAGNNLNRPFEVDVTEKETEIRNRKEYAIPFTVE